MASTKEINQPNFYSQSIEESLSQLEVDPKNGLTTPESETRLNEHGKNKLEEKKKEIHFYDVR
jgi:magnesium-transporting ATPase (P-type)